MFTWNADSPSLITFSGTDNAGTALLFTLTRVGAGPAFTAELKKNGAGQGTIQLPDLATAKDLFTIVAEHL